MSLTRLDQGVCAPAGFRAAGVVAGIKPGRTLDLALVVSDSKAVAAGVFTTNRAAAAPVKLCGARLADGVARGVVINSGCANAVTGERGRRDAEAMADEAAARLGIPASQMLVCSTGPIGSYLPMEKVRKGIAAAAGCLGKDDESAARAIMTTDTRPKRAGVEHERGWRLGGIAKGAGMIAPQLAPATPTSPTATMLAVLATDALAGPDLLREVLEQAADLTFNAITIDGDTSTNDSVLIFANGHSGIAPDGGELLEALLAVSQSLAEAIVADGEGATKMVRVRVIRARDAEQAKRAARRVAESLLVKTSLYGGDANWGRVAAALGVAGVDLDLGRLGISIGGVGLVSEGRPKDEASHLEARAALRAREVEIVCDLASGSASAEMLTTDLTPEYVRLNAAYET
ncbi:MAG: bifunctional glutamate N-acetyltransferase/amino-acid acetyltransferase ArgJ [Actinomycetota bacterium]